MAGKTECPVLCHQQFRVLGNMGRMAGQAAFSGCNRRVGDDGLLSLIGMAAETELVAGIGKKLHVFRIMGVVAGKAHAALERRVFDLSAGLEPGLIMALIAELAATLRRAEGFYRVGRVVACITGHRNKGVVGAGL